MQPWMLIALAGALAARLTSGIGPTAFPQPAPQTQPAAADAPLLDVGDAAPPIRATRWLNGRPVVVDERSSPRVLILAFWASWSGPSRAALADLVRLHELYSKRGVILVGVTAERAEAAAMVGVSWWVLMERSVMIGSLSCVVELRTTLRNRPLPVVWPMGDRRSRIRRIRWPPECTE